MDYSIVIGTIYTLQFQYFLVLLGLCWNLLLLLLLFLIFQFHLKVSDNLP